MKSALSPCVFAFALICWTADSPPAGAAEPSVSTSDLGDVVGAVVKVSDGSVTLKVPTVVQTGATRKRVGKRTITVPKYTTKQVESTFTLAKDVKVSSTGGKAADLSDVRAGDPVRLHVYKVTERAVGEKPVAHAEVRRVEVAGSAKK